MKGAIDFTSNIPLGIVVPIPTFHQVLNIFVSTIHEDQFRYGVAPAVVHACKNHVFP